MLGPVPPDLFAILLSDMAGAVGRAYSLFGDPDVPEIRYQVGRTATVDGGLGCSDLLWVNLQRIEPSLVSAGDSPCSVLPDAIVALDLQRCWPVPDDAGRIDVAAERAATLRLARDMTILWYGIMQQRQSGDLLPSFDFAGTICDAVRPLQVLPVGPAGGSAGYTWTIRVSLVATLRDR